MIQEPIQPGLPTPDEASARQRCLHEGVNAPDLATVKDFLRFHAATSRGKIDEEERLTANSLNAFAEWFFAGVTWITGTRQTREIGARSITWVLFLEGIGNSISQSPVGPENAGSRGPGGEQEETAAQFLRTQPHPHLGPRTTRFHPRPILPPVHLHFPGLLLDWSQNQCVLYERAPLWGESFVPDSLQGTTY
jgi:hypothetical protein